MSKIWKIEVTLTVDESWIADGFNAANRLEEIEEKLTYLLPYAYENEFKVTAKIKTAPDAKVIQELQGF